MLLLKSSKKNNEQALERKMDMGEKKYRFFGGMLASQEKWLNKMAKKGWKLVRTGKLLYEFEPCAPGQMQYCVEFIGQKPEKAAKEYHDFLEDMGYQVFYKNINLQYSTGKVYWYPFAERGGALVTNARIDKELLIVGRENDGTPFTLHTGYEDRLNYYRMLRKPSLFLLLVFVGLGVVLRAWYLEAVAILPLIPLLSCQIGIWKLKKQEKQEK